MRVRVFFFGVLREAFPEHERRLELPEGAAVAELVEHYRAEQPELSALWRSLAVAVNREYASAAHVLAEDDEVALLPPVSGGAGAVRLTRERIDAAAILDAAKKGADGAVVCFDGIVRNNTRGRQTLYLDYHAYEEMARAQMEALSIEAQRRYEVREVALVHRLGRIGIGETSVLIVVSSAHRAAAFDACRWVIDTLKKTVPIWKKEYFVDGAVWADGEPFPEELTGARA